MSHALRAQILLQFPWLYVMVIHPPAQVRQEAAIADRLSFETRLGKVGGVIRARTCNVHVVHCVCRLCGAS
jgi:hypothetical protein